MGLVKYKCWNILKTEKPKDWLIQTLRCNIFSTLSFWHSYTDQITVHCFLIPGKTLYICRAHLRDDLLSFSLVGPDCQKGSGHSQGGEFLFPCVVIKEKHCPFPSKVVKSYSKVMFSPEIWCPRFGGLGFSVFVYGLNKSAKVVITWAWGFFLYLLYVTHLDNLKKNPNDPDLSLYSAASIGIIADIFQLKHYEFQF